MPMIMKDRKDEYCTKFSHQYDGGSMKIEFTLDVDSDMGQLLEDFLTFAKAMSFHQVTIDNAVLNKAESIQWDRDNKEADEYSDG